MEVTLKIAFTILDGRLSTEINNIYKILNYIFDEEFNTHELSKAIITLRERNPEWFQKGVNLLNEIKDINQTNDFNDLMEIIDKDFADFIIHINKI